VKTSQAPIAASATINRAMIAARSKSGTAREQIPRIFHGSEAHVCVTFCAILPIRFFKRSKKPLFIGLSWWTHKGSNLGPLPCEGNALPLSYASGISCNDQSPVNRRLIEQSTLSEPAIYEGQGTGVKLSASNA
jgi:hypothetical protein